MRQGANNKQERQVGGMTYRSGGGGGSVGGLDLLRGAVVIRLFLLRILVLRGLHGLVVGLKRSREVGNEYKKANDATCRLLLLGHVLPLLRDQAEQISVGEVGMLFLEFLADLVLKEDVGRGGALGRVGVLGFGSALALLGTVLFWREMGPALALCVLVYWT